jgi:hypothetical protein
VDSCPTPTRSPQDVLSGDAGSQGLLDRYVDAKAMFDQSSSLRALSRFRSHLFRPGVFDIAVYSLESNHKMVGV